MYFLLNSDLPTILASEETAIIIIIIIITRAQSYGKGTLQSLHRSSSASYVKCTDASWQGKARQGKV
jgi:hypothetical protein